MNEQELREQIGISMEAALAPQVGALFPAAAIDIWHDGESLYRGAFGRVAGGMASAQPASVNTLFDLDSLTELFTATAFLRLVDGGRLWIDTPVDVVLPDMDAEITFYHLLTHTSGLPAAPDLCALADYEARMAAVESAKRVHPVGVGVLHSELNFILLGQAIEALMNLPFEQAVALLLLQPLDLRAEFAPLSRLSSVALTGAHAEAHNANARCLDGIAGHAGLFGTVGDLAKLAQLYMDYGVYNYAQLLSNEVMAEATRVHTDGRGLGWQVAGDQFAHRAEVGVYLEADRTRSLVVALATNSAQFGTPIAALDAFWAALLESVQQLIDQEDIA